MKTSYLFLADGFEEIEALSTVDIMRRAGLDVKTVSITDSHNVTGAHGITVKADALIDHTSLDDAEWLIAPGGMPGAANLAACSKLTEALYRHNAEGRKIAAICAAPAVVLAPLGILNGREATCYPGFESQCHDAIIKDDVSVVVSDNVITANGPAAAMPFALTIVDRTLGPNVAKEIGRGLLFYPQNFNFYF